MSTIRELLGVTETLCDGCVLPMTVPLDSTDEYFYCSEECQEVGEQARKRREKRAKLASRKDPAKPCFACGGPATYRANNSNRAICPSCGHLAWKQCWSKTHRFSSNPGPIVSEDGNVLYPYKCMICPRWHYSRYKFLDNDLEERRERLTKIAIAFGGKVPDKQVVRAILDGRDPYQFNHHHQ